MNFSFWVEDDLIKVRLVAPRKLGRIEGDVDRHSVGGDYRNKKIRLPLGEYRNGLRSALLHELGHYLVERQDVDLESVTEEDICDVLTWLPHILTDPRNDPLRTFLGLELS